MRLSGLTAVAAVLVPLVLLTSRSSAQLPIRVVRHLPADTARSGDVITISFDRPVAGSLERSAKPERFVTIEPKIQAAIEWRDPVTLRVTPTQPLPPGRRYRITIDDRLTAIDGGRLAAPYRFTLHTRGPTLFATSVGELSPQETWKLTPTGRIALAYTAPVDSEILGRSVRLQLTSDQRCDAQTIRYAVHEQRPVVDSIDDWASESSDDGKLVQAFRRVVELWPEKVPPAECAGDLVIPSLDPLDRAEIRYRVATAAEFQAVALDCVVPECAERPALRLRFNAEVPYQRNATAIHIEPAIPFTIDEFDGASADWTIRLALTPRTTYRVRVDSTIRDAFGRSLSGRTEVSRFVPDRVAALGHQSGSFTVSRQHAVIRVTHVNVDSAELSIVPIPDSLRGAMIRSTDAAAVAALTGKLVDTIRVTVPLAGALNEQRITEIPIPPAVLARHPTALLAIRARTFGRRQPGERFVPANGQPIPNVLQIVPRPGVLGEPTLSAIVQITDLVVHARVSDGWGSVFVTDMSSGLPVVGASVTVLDDANAVVASGITNGAGIVDTRRSPDWRPREVANITTDLAAYNVALRNYYDDYPFRRWTVGKASRVDVSYRGDRASVAIPTMPDWDPAFGRSTVDWSYDRSRLARATVFSDRGIYRPGEMVFLKAIVRDGWLNDLRLPSANDSLRIRIAGSSVTGEREFVRDTVVRVTSYGTAADSFRLAPGAPLGMYELWMETPSGSGWHATSPTDFRVAEYRAPEFRAALDVDSVPVFLGDTIAARISATYYFDAPMARATVRWLAVTSERTEPLAIPGLSRDFAIGDRYEYADRETPENDVISGKTMLDHLGQARLRLPTRRGLMTGPADVTITIAVDDISHQTVVVSSSRIAHATSFYVAARDSSRSWYWRQGDQRVVQIITVRPDGRRVPQVRVGIAVVRQQRVNTQRDGYEYPVVRWIADTVARDVVTTTDSVVSYRFTPAQSGSYHLVLTAADEHGRTATTTLGGYVIPAQWAVGLWRNEPTEPPLHLVRDSVSIGDTLAVTFISPFERAEAWLTVEREGILAQRLMLVTRGETMLRVPVDSSFLPGGTVTLLLVDRNAAWAADSLHKRVRWGKADFVVDVSPRALHVAIMPLATRHQPGEAEHIAVRLTGTDGRAARGEVTLWAVDEAILALAEYERPDPLARMYEQRSGALVFATSAAGLALHDPMLGASGWRTFGGMAQASALTAARVLPLPDVADVRADFRSTAFFVASMIADSTGVATTTVKLPDNLTTYRLFAIGVGADNRFGAGETSLVVTKPLIARSALPRFVRPGDDFVARMIVNNRSVSPIRSHVRSSGSSAAPRDTTLTVAGGEGVGVGFRRGIAQQPGDTAVFRFAVEGGEHTDAVQASLPVRAPYSPRHHTMAGVARGSAVVRMTLPAGLDPARSRLTLRLGSTPLPAIRAAYDMLDAYPYACTEQLTSLGRAIVTMLRLQRAGLVDSMTSPTVGELRGRLQVIVDELARRQSYDGGIAYWTTGSWTTNWLTGSAGMLLTDARAMGITVRASVLEGITKYFRDVPDGEAIVADTVHGTRTDRARARAWNLSSRLSRLFYSRSFGAPDTTGELALLAHERDMVWEDRVWLAELLAARADRSLARAALQRAWDDVQVVGARIDLPASLLATVGFPSRVRPIARLLRATMMVEPTHPQIGLLVERVVQQGRGNQDRFRNTQDWVASAEALTDVALWQRGQRQSSIVVRSALAQGGTELFRLSAGASQQFSVALDGLVQVDGASTVLPLRLEGDGAPVFYALTVDEVPLVAPTTPDAQGMIVERWYERFSDGKPVTQVKEGDLVRGRLRLTVPSDREFVAIEDMLPAGLEVLDLTLRTTSSLGPFVSETWGRSEDIEDWEPSKAMPWLYGSWADGWWSPWEHKELRDDRVVYFARTLWKGSYSASYVARATTAGTFIRPPAHAEEMYNASLGGRSDGGVFRVEPR